MRLSRVTRWHAALTRWRLNTTPSPFSQPRPKTPFFKKQKPILPDHILSDKRVKAVVPLLGKGSYVMLAGGFLMTDFLYLRILLTGGYAALTCFHIFQKHPLRIPLAGSFFFICVNAGMALLLCKERYWMLSEEEKRIYDENFALEMSQSDFKEFVSHGSMNTDTQRSLIVRAGEVADLIFVLDGCAEVMAESGVIKVEKAGLIGEISFLNGGKAAANVYALPGCRYMHWERNSLLGVLERSPSLRNGVELKIARDLIDKLKRKSWREQNLMKELAA